MTAVHRQLILVMLASAALTACATTGAVPRPFPGAPTPPSAIASPAPSTTAVTSALITTALSYRGVPYRNGGSDPMGFDCSGFVQWVFAQQGHALPREVHDQYAEGKKVDRDDVKPGDLVFFHTEGK